MMSFYLIADALDEILNPKLRRRWGSRWSWESKKKWFGI
jgi:hypothetical protein